MRVLLLLNIFLICNFCGLFDKESAWLSLLENIPLDLCLHAPSVEGT